MKKLILSLFLVISFTFSYAQKANVSKAKNKALMDNPDYAGAREAIKQALQDSTTKNLAETWYVAGLIGYSESDAAYKKALLRMRIDTVAKGKALLESYNYFLQADKLDQQPDAKGKVKPKYTKDIKAKFTDYYKTQQHLISYGAYQFEKKDFVGAYNTFGVFLEIPKLPLMNNEIKMDSTYDMITYYAGISAINAKMTDKAISLFETLKTKKYETKAVYQSLYEQYMNKKDSTNAVNTLKEAVNKFPSDMWFMQNLINYYIYSKKINEALVYLNAAIEKEPTMGQYYYVKGNLEEANNNFDAALAALDKSIQLDPTMADAYAAKGRLHYNKAVKMAEEANKIKDVKAYNAEMKKVDGVFKESVPFFKKASEMNPKEIDYKKTLKILYYRLKMDAEFEAINKEIKAM